MMEFLSRRCKISPLILAAIFITFFHNVLSRHKIRHYKDRFKRQQGANLYLPGSFVTDNNDTQSGYWEEWSAPGPCSRTCGGGVSTQTRRCVQGYDCSGPAARYFSCNTQDCEDQADFRAQQCAEHNTIPFEGINYEWIPYTKGPNPCELNCMPKGERFYYRHADIVVDGTKCTDEGYDICVQGQCQPVGCDRMLGSTAREDQCRVCGGDGSTCNTFTNTIPMKDMQVGYNDILLIPAGATNIRIEEMSPSNNYLAVRNTQGQYYLNGNWRIDFPRANDFAGTRFKYERTPQEFDAPDIITSLGPTDESLFIVLLYQGSDVPVTYSYSLSTRIPSPPNETYNWIHDEFTPCSVSCGKGLQYRNVTCAGRSSLEAATDSLCEFKAKPEDTRVCNEVDCAPIWVPEEWSNCSVPCGEAGGIQTRKTICYKTFANGSQEVVSDFECTGLAKPKTKKKCNVNKICPKWYIQPWIPCDHLCGDGKQSRKITCYVEDENRKKKILPDSECDAVEKKPVSEKSCNLRPCEGVDWITTEWSGCDACGLTQETRNVLCATEDEKIQSDELCDSDRKPETVRECVSPPCQYLWYASQWSECSVTCGVGVQTRVIFCGISSPNGIEKVDNSECDPSKDFETVRNCTGEQEKCEGEWFVGPMGECSKPCGGGQRSRKIMCISDNQVVDRAACGSKIVFSEENCNDQPCSEDTIMPLPPRFDVDETVPPSQKREVTTSITMGTDENDIFELTTPSVTTAYPDEFEIVPDTNCEDGEWVDEYDEENVQGDDPFAYEDLMMGDQPYEGSGNTIFGSTDDYTDALFTSDTDITTETSVPTDTTLSIQSITTTPSNEEYPEGSVIESAAGADVPTTSPKPKNQLTDSTESSLSTSEIVASTESIGTNTDYTGSTATTERYTGSTASFVSSEATGSSESTTQSTGSTNLLSSTKISESSTDFTETTDISETTLEVLRSSESSASTETPESTESTITMESDGSTKSSESTTELTGSTNLPLSSTEVSKDSTVTETTNEFTTSTESLVSTNTAESTVETKISTEISKETTGSTASTAPYQSSTEFSKSTETSESSTDFSMSTDAFRSTTDLTDSTDSIGSTGTSTELDEITRSSSANTESTEAVKPTTDATKSTDLSQSTNELTVSTESSQSTIAYTDVTETSTHADSSDSTESSKFTKESTESSTDTTESSKTEPFESTTGITAESTEAVKSTTESSGSTDNSRSTSDNNESTSTSKSSTEFSRSSEFSESTTAFAGSTESVGSTTEISLPTDISKSTTDVTGSTEPLVSKTPSTGLTDFSELTTHFMGSTDLSRSTAEFSGSTTELSMSTTGISESTEVEVSESTTESTVSTDSSKSSTDSLSSTEDLVSTTESLTSTDFVVSTTPNTSSEISGSTELTAVTTESVESTSEGTTTAGSTEPLISTTEVTSSSYSTKSNILSSEFTETTTNTEITQTSTDIIATSTEITSSGSSTESNKLSSEFTESTTNTEITQISTDITATSTDIISSSEGTTESTRLSSESTDETTQFTVNTESTIELHGSTMESTESTRSSTQFSESTESSTEFMVTTESSTQYTGSTESSTEFTGSTEVTTEFTRITTGYTEKSSESAGSSTASFIEIFTTKKLRMCKRRKIKQCKKSEHGCCWDNITPAKGPFDKGCPTPHTCKESKFGCCDDGVSAALGPKNAGCPLSHCNDTLFGCCPDKKTPSQGNDNEGCPPECLSTKFGCCDNFTTATGPHHKGCPEETTTSIITTEAMETSTESTSEMSTITISSTEVAETSSATEGSTDKSTNIEYSSTELTTEITTMGDCNAAPYKCCPDGVTTATGPGFHGCGLPCSDSKFACCQDGQTPAHGPSGEGCCLSSQYGCCPDNIIAATGPNQAGCDCRNSPYGCCPDNKTSAEGYDNAGCGCQYTTNGCCPDNFTPAAGPDYQGCPCHTFQFGCCADGFTTAEGPRGQGCGCRNKEFGCCSDGETPASGPNQEKCSCETTKYGCCNDGVTAAEGENYEGCTEIVPNLQAGCYLTKERGRCRNYTVKWFFDMDYGGCSRFWYGGCDGNENRYRSKEECEDICVQPQGTDRCKLPKVSGPCEGYYLNWYYDQHIKQCTQFVYGGCLGNNNRFDSKEDCVNVCGQDVIQDPCQQKKDQGPCRGQFQRFYYDKDLAQCEEFTYGGCKGNDNNFPTMESCKQQCAPIGRKKDLCSLPKSEGNCTDVYANWYYDTPRKTCTPFYYSGCFGNLNNFESKEACQSDCPSDIDKDTCQLPADTGDCDIYVNRWYYDTRAKACHQFYYGGCGGNGNNFETLERCTERCEQQQITAAPPLDVTEGSWQPQPAPPFTIDMCFLPAYAGPCRAALRKYHYDAADGVCKEFIFGGCDSNGNNFDSVEECFQSCGAAQDLCSLPRIQGSCGGQFPQFYYDQSTDSCQQFMYSGCDGNYNRFQDHLACEQRCKKVREDHQPSTQAPTVKPDVAMCSQEPDQGNCSSRFTAFYYDEERRTCTQFYYTGCGGNSNRFNSEEQCERQCGVFKDQDVCNMERDPGRCRGYLVRYYFDKSTGRCEQFAYGGCEGNGNRFSTEEECAQSCITHDEKEPSLPINEICRLQVDRGPCEEDSQKRWYFDDFKGDCMAFIYSGCGGNFNNFKSYQYCLDYCKELLRNPESQPTITTDLPPHPCQEAFDECTTLRCAYGVEPYVDENKCNRCQCRDPCVGVDCMPDEQCAIDINRHRISAQDADFIAVCRKRLKPGTCPQIDIRDDRCEHECNNDADCALQMKCCPTVCGTTCVDSPAELVTQEPAYTEEPVGVQFRPPYVDPTEYKPEVSAVIGDQATLRCAVSGNPNPTIRWSKDNLEIDGTQPRYRIKLDQSLQIITLHKTDSGIYLCTAFNGVGESIINKVKLEVIDSEPRPVTILSEPGDEQPIVVSLNAPTTLNCFVLGNPFPAVTWWKDDSMIPFKNSEFEIRKDYSLLIHSVRLYNLGIYTCQAYNGFGKAASWSVTVKTRGPINIDNPGDLRYSKWILDQDVPTTTTSTTTTTRATTTMTTTTTTTTTVEPILTPSPDWEIPDTPNYPVIIYTEPPNEIIPNTLPDAEGGVQPPTISVPVKVNISSTDQKYPVDSDIEIPCDVWGYPVPQVQWYKDGVALQESEKIYIAESERSSILTIYQSKKADSGLYQCEAANAYSRDSSSLEIAIEGMYIHPSCVDNRFFANCALIVKSQYCSHPYYSKFCCRSCTEAGLLPVDGPHIHKSKRHDSYNDNLV